MDDIANCRLRWAKRLGSFKRQVLSKRRAFIPSLPLTLYALYFYDNATFGLWLSGPNPHTHLLLLVEVRLSDLHHLPYILNLIQDCQQGPGTHPSARWPRSQERARRRASGFAGTWDLATSRRKLRRPRHGGNNLKAIELAGEGCNQIFSRIVKVAVQRV